MFERLPPTALVDTGVFMRFLGDRPHEPKSHTAREFCRAMLRAQRELFVAAPTIAEILRHQPGGVVVPVPKLPGVTVVAFDGAAAEHLGARMPHAQLTELRDASGQPLAYFKYDALIVACGIRWHADVVVSYDDQLRSIAKRAGFPAEEPDHYLRRSRLQAVPAPPPAPAPLVAAEAVPPVGPLFAKTGEPPPAAAGGDPPDGSA
jgi:predicted nucleic acid-binding protein